MRYDFCKDHQITSFALLLSQFLQINLTIMLFKSLIKLWLDISTRKILKPSNSRKTTGNNILYIIEVLSYLRIELTRQDPGYN